MHFRSGYPGMKQEKRISAAIMVIIVTACLLVSCSRADHKVLPPSRPVPEKEILTYSGTDSVLDSFVKVPFEQLDAKYLEYTGYKRAVYRKGIEDKIFYRITNREANRILAGTFRVIDFLPKDSLRLRSVIDTSVVQYLCIEREVLHRLLDLVNALARQGYNKYGFKIKDGYRYPDFNNRTGGARMSQHMFGRAIDIAISDINGDGVFTESVDKKIIYSLLDTAIIRNSGGLGGYPGTNVVHFDTRGSRARW